MEHEHQLDGVCDKLGEFEMGKTAGGACLESVCGGGGEGMGISSFEYLKFRSMTHSRGWHLDVSVMFREDK